MRSIFQVILIVIVLSIVSSVSRAGILEGVLEGRTTVLDLTYPLNGKNAYWPFGPYTPFTYEVIATRKKDLVYSGKYSTPEHLGTHIDAPNHFEENQPSVDQIPFEQLIGPAIKIDICNKTEKNPDYTLLQADIQNWENKYGQIPEGSIVLLHTGWDRRWHNYERYKNMDKSSRMHFPGFSKEAAAFLVKQRNVKGIGIDTLSGDCGLSSDFQVHHIVNGAGKFILENVANLDQLPITGAILIIAPIKIEGGSGGQCRIWALLPR